ncbi:hypothetical protein NliqN6_4556 [Naganishia liquefaciens]|uniref:MoaD/ThiS family protein n=1 Tax=Naganishia liquefaciens TaxID=104408 RepID=A0A8H3TW46_9TREE|nr:hypothetical protein NliqN6_4556 [Naganishia liquefaciens]
MPTITILYFAAIRTLLSTATDHLPLPLSPHSPTSRLADLPSAIARLHPEADADALARILEGCMWSVDEEMVDLEEEAGRGGRVLCGGEIVAVIPPVSGG